MYKIYNRESKLVATSTLDIDYSVQKLLLEEGFTIGEEYIDCYEEMNMEID